MPQNRGQPIAVTGVLGEARGRLLSELCGRPQTVAALAERVGTSANAVRVHLDALRETGLVEYQVVRGGVGKPAHKFSLTPTGEYLLSSAYAPMLAALLEAVGEKLDGGLLPVVRDAGIRLGRRREREVTQKNGIDRGVEVLRSLGAVPTVETSGKGVVVRSACCPLGAVTRRAPTLCAAFEAMLEATIGLPVREQCDRGAHPRCAFVIEKARPRGRKTLRTS